MIYPCAKCGSKDVEIDSHNYQHDENEIIVLRSLLCHNCQSVTSLTSKYVLYQTRVNKVVQPYD